MKNNNLPNKENDFDIAIISMSGRFPGANSVDEFWQNLCSGVESITFFSDEELKESGIDPAVLSDPNYIKASPILHGPEMFDASFFGYSPREAKLVDPQQRLFLECAWEALEHAGYDADRYEGRIGVYAGASMNTYLLFSGLIPHLSTQYLPILIGSDKDYLTTRVSYKLNLKGPSVTVQTACSTSLVAVHIACQSLLNEECDMALAGGSSIRVPHRVGYFYQEGSIFSPDGHCRAFDAKARGTIFGSGVGVVVLKRSVDAIADGDSIHAVIKGSAINNDGSSKVGYTAPSVNGQSEVIVEALANSGIAADTISYVESHGTGTALGDPIEIAALTNAFRTYTDKKGFCAIGSVKTNIGHLDAAAGVASLIKTVLALKHQAIPPSLHFETPNPKIDFANSPFYVNSRLSEWKSDGTPRRAGVSSFGIGGTNAHVVLQEAPEIEASGPSRPRQLVLLSAKTKSALDAVAANVCDHLRQNPPANIADVAYTLQTGRKAFSHRRFTVCNDAADAVQALKSLDPNRIKTRHIESRDPEVVFMFPGQGAQYVNMGLNLYEHEPVFREALDQSAEILEPILGRDLRQLLYPESTDLGAAEELLRKTSFQQPAIFTIEYALAKLWKNWGVRPAAMIGHSIGEYVAACIAEVFSLKDALMLVATRGRMMQELPGGAMLSVRLPVEEIESKLNGNLSIAAINAPSLCVVSGPTEAVAMLQHELEKEDVICRRLHTSHAFHSPIMDSIVKPFAERVKAVQLSPPAIPFISTVTGTWITPEQATDHTYWGRQLRATVRFAEGVEKLWEKPERVLLEVGPRATCSTLARQQAKDISKQTVIASLGDTAADQAEWTVMLTALGQLWLAGVPIDWEGFYQREMRHRVALPTYPFERKRFWIEPARHMSGAQALGDVTEQPTRDDDLEVIIPQSAEQLVPDPLSEDEYDAPHTEAEILLAATWQEVLGVDRVSVDDNYFSELGGDSLSVVRVIEIIRKKTGMRLDPKMFPLNTLRQIAPHLKLEPSLAAPKPAEEQTKPQPAFVVRRVQDKSEISALYFGNSQRPLFGVYHPPRPRVAKDVGVLLCYPIAQEYMTTHWAFRRLSNLLSKAGFHVLRFDYFGTGDSAGDSGGGNVIQWKADIHAAATELKNKAGVKKVSVVGLRLGAALAAEASNEGLDVKELVLWDPVVNGKSHIGELKAMHHDRFPNRREQATDGNFDELLGFPFPSELRTSIEQIDLLDPPHCIAERPFLIVSEERSEYLQLRDQLTAAGMQVGYRPIRDTGDWEKIKAFDQALLVNDILHAITAALTTEASR